MIIIIIILTVTIHLCIRSKYSQKANAISGIFLSKVLTSETSFNSIRTTNTLVINSEGSKRIKYLKLRFFCFNSILNLNISANKLAHF